MSENSFKTWMADLPQETTRVPLCSLAIPGSHDSGAYWLDRAGGIAEDEPSIIRTLANSCCCGISVVYQWALTQNLSVKGQLEHGVRYLDLRLCGRPGSPDVHVAHGLYGHRLHDILLEIKEFMDENQKEFIILDFNHFHNMTSVDHREVLILIIKIFGVQILGGDTPMSAWSITLDNLWKTPARLMVFYGHPARNEFSFFWSEEYLQSPWPTQLVHRPLSVFMKTIITRVWGEGRESFTCGRGSSPPQPALL